MKLIRDISKIDFNDHVIVDKFFSKIIMTREDVKDGIIRGCTFSECIFQNVRFESLTFPYSIFSKCIFEGLCFDGCDLSETQFFENDYKNVTINS